MKACLQIKPMYCSRDYNFTSRSVLLFEKLYKGRQKRITYIRDTWSAAEKYFYNVHVTQQTNQVLKMNLAVDVFLISSVWFKNSTTYRGMHHVDRHGQIKPLTVMNLEEEDWSALNG